MKPNIYKIIEFCVENGTLYGVEKAYDYGKPTKEQIAQEVEMAIMNEICEWFEFN